MFFVCSSNYQRNSHVAAPTILDIWTYLIFWWCLAIFVFISLSLAQPMEKYIPWKGAWNHNQVDEVWKSCYKHLFGSECVKIFQGRCPSNNVSQLGLICSHRALFLTTVHFLPRVCWLDVMGVKTSQKKKSILFPPFLKPKHQHASLVFTAGDPGRFRYMPRRPEEIGSELKAPMSLNKSCLVSFSRCTGEWVDSNVHLNLDVYMLRLWGMPKLCNSS